jgi:hypothetical protein
MLQLKLSLTGEMGKKVQIARYLALKHVSARLAVDLLKRLCKISKTGS